MKAFSIRRNKQSASDPTTDDFMSTSQPSVYGSVMSSRPRNRLHKPHRSLDETHSTTPAAQVQNHDVTKRPHRKLVKKSKQQTRSDSSPEEGGSLTPPEQKSHSNSLPTAHATRGPIGRSHFNWTETELGSLPRSRVPRPARHSIGSSADVLLTPIRGSTAFTEDFVFLPAARAVEADGPDDSAASPDTEKPESPGSIIVTLPSGSKTRREVELAGENADVIARGLVPTESSSGSEPGSNTSRRLSSIETPAVQDLGPRFKIGGISSTDSGEATPIAPVAKGASSLVTGGVQVRDGSTVRRPTNTRDSSKSSVKPTEAHNIVPFPSPGDPELGPWHSTLARSEIVQQPPQNSPTALALWVYNVCSTVAGILTLAMECYRWLARKGFRDDFRSRMSYWFLRELTRGFAVPLVFAGVALWWLYGTMGLRHDLMPMNA